ncbi:MAG: hypothetical protein PF569_07935 [Candidatus Woesearchaeota archaeon]|jgi:ATP-dependent Zn protease|nr:hypothetical protein [Candidatus Woesearchaeota archaeon]
MWPFKKKQAQEDPNKEAYKNFQNQVMGTNPTQNNQYTQSVQSQPQTQSQPINQEIPIQTQTINEEKNIYIQKDQNGYAIIFYVVLLIIFIVYFIFLK